MTPEQQSAAPAFTHAQVVRVLIGIVLCILLAAIDQTVVIPAVPAIAADLNGFDHLSWIVTAYLLTATALTPIYGKLSDIHGRRALLLPAIVIFVVASVLCALSQTLWQLIAARGLQGVGGAGLMAMSQATIADVVAPRERGRYQGYMAGTWGVASIGGPILGGWLTDYFSWHAIFWINLPIGLAAYLLSSHALRLLVPPRRQVRVDYIGAGLLTALVTVLLLVMTWGGSTYPWVSWPIGLMLLGAVALGLVLAWQEWRVSDALLPPRLFTNSTLMSGVAMAFLASAGLLGGTFLLPLFFQLLRGADAQASGMMVVPFLVASVVGAYASGQMTRRLGRARPVLLAGLVGAAVGFAMLAMAGAMTPLAVVLLGMAVVGAGLGMCMPTGVVVVQNAAPPADVGTATGALLLLRSMGGAVGSTMVGALLTSRFQGGLAAAGLASHLELSSLRGQGAGALGLDQHGWAVARAALAGGFNLAFAACGVLAMVALLVVWRMPDRPLRSGTGR